MCSPFMRSSPVLAVCLCLLSAVCLSVLALSRAKKNTWTHPQKCTALAQDIASTKEAAAAEKSEALAAAGTAHKSAVSRLQSQLQSAQAQVQAANESASAQSQDSAELAKLRTIAAGAEQKIAAEKAACVHSFLCPV